MASKRRLRRNACTGKQRYDDRAGADRGLAALRRRLGSDHSMTSYKCGFCGGYHYGHTPSKVKQAITSRRGF